MKYKRSLMSIAMAAIVLLSLCAVCASTSVGAAQGANVRAPALVGATVVGAPAVCSQNGMDLFVRGANTALYWKHSNDGKTWPTTSTNLGGVATSDPAATSPGTLQIDVFVRGSNGALYEKTTTNGGATWSSWYSHGGQLLAGTGPAAYSFTSGATAQTGWFVTGTNHALYWQVSGSTSWVNLGGYLTSSPSVAAPGGTTPIMVLTGRGTNGALYEKDSWNGGVSWSSWASLGGQLLAGTGPAGWGWAAPGITTTTGTFVTGTNHALYYPWPNWLKAGGYLTSSPAAISPSPGLIDVFGRGSNGYLYENTCSNLAGDVWSGWTSIGGI